MIIVAGGSGSRFSNDKMLTPVDGRPLVEITVERVRPHVRQCVLVCRADQLAMVESMQLGVRLAVGGPTRTTSELAGLKALGRAPTLIGIHDGARPNVGPHLIEELFETAKKVGGAVPIIEPSSMLIDRETLEPLDGVYGVQTPQVFHARELIDAYVLADEEGFSGHDTLEVIQRFTSLEVAAVEGSPTNIKVTYPGDLARVIPL
jgi:2-C-methyl-D-erythritol 4-phosphate cytidylyltransferase